MNKNIEIKNIPVEKIKIGDEEFIPKDSDLHRSWALEIKKNGLKRPLLVTKVGQDYVLYNCLIHLLLQKMEDLKRCHVKL